MSFADAIARRHRFLIVVQISGLPVLVSNGRCPANWGTTEVTLDGEVYTWLPDLVVGTPPALKGLAERLECWGAIGASSSTQLKIAASLPVIALLDGSGDWPHLDADLTWSASSATLTEAEALDASGVAYLAEETIRYTSRSGATLGGLTRGAYGSLARHHVATWDGISEVSYGGALVGNRPLTHAGRIVRVWLVPCDEVDGQLYALRSTPFDAECHEFATGRCVGWTCQDGTTSVLDLVDLVSLTERAAGARLPRATVGHPGLIQVDQWSNELALLAVNPSTGTVQYYPGTLTVAHELVTPAILGAAIWAAMDTSGLATGGVLVEAVRVATGVAWRVTIDIEAMATPRPQCAFRATPSSIWRELGLEADTVVEDSGLADRAQWVLEIPRPRPRLRLPVAQLRTVWLDRPALTGLWPGAASGAVDAAAAPLRECVQIGDEVCAVEAASTLYVGGRFWHGVTLLQRGLFGTRQLGDVYAPDDTAEDPLEARGGLSLLGCEWPRAVAYALCAGAERGGDYDGAGWRGSGAGIPEDLVDVAQLEALLDEVGGRDRVDLWIDESVSVRDLLQPLLVSRGCYLSVRAGRLWVGRVPQPGAAPQRSYSGDQIRGERLRWDRAERNVRTSVVGADIARSAATARVVDGPASATWPDGRPVELALRHASSVARGTAELVAAAGRHLGLWSRPYVAAVVLSADPADLLTELGTPVEITHALPVHEGARGVAGLRGVVYGRAPAIGGDGIELTILLPGRPNASTPRLYAPCARGATYSAGASTTRIDTAEHYYSRTGGAVSDAQQFALGETVRIYAEGDESGAVSAVVTGVASDSLEVDEVLTLATPVIVECPAWASASAAQRERCYLASGSLPYLVGGVDPAAAYEP